jgi:hypothetical protein
MASTGFDTDEARRFGEEIGIDWATAPFAVEEFRTGMNVELEHGLHDQATNVTNDDPRVTAKIAPTTTPGSHGWRTRRSRTGPGGRPQLDGSPRAAPRGGDSGLSTGLCDTGHAPQTARSGP